MDSYFSSNQRMWDELARINAASEFYELQAFRQGAIKLNPLEIGEVGGVHGKRLLHLQCHFGMDTLSWKRLGADVTGVDFSPEGIRIARELSVEQNLPARFINCNIYDLPQHLDETFDVVFTSYGVLGWLPDIHAWAQLAARYVKPGGIFYIAEFHPFSYVFEDGDLSLTYRYPYFDKNVQEWENNQGSYADHSAIIQTPKSYEWMHSLGEVVSELIAAGLTIEFLHEHPFSVYEQFPGMVKQDDGYWHIPGKDDAIPLMYSIRARK